MTNYQTKSPVLFLIFNRPDTTLQVFNQIRLAKPKRLYIAADGARKNQLNDAVLCEKAREISTKIDWECDLKTLFRKENLGCKNAVSSAIDWFFEQEEEGIILEDDCLPSSSFFSFCDQMLERYRADSRIRHITGSNLQLGQAWGEASYYFSRITAVWGWASWRRVWKEYDKDLLQYNETEVQHQLNNIFSDTFLEYQWMKVFKALKANEINTWDYQLALINYFNNGLSVTPNVNLISNIGFRADATHTPDSGFVYSQLPLEEIGEMVHPQYYLPETEADNFIFNKEFRLDEIKKKHFSLRRRFKRWLKSLF